MFFRGRHDRKREAAALLRRMTLPGPLTIMRNTLEFTLQRNVRIRRERLLSPASQVIRETEVVKPGKYGLVIVFKTRLKQHGPWWDSSLMAGSVVPLRMCGVASLHGDPVCIHSCCGEHSREQAVSIDTQVPFSEFVMTAPVLFCLVCRKPSLQD